MNNPLAKNPDKKAIIFPIFEGIASSETIFHECIGGEKVVGLSSGNEYILTSPRYPQHYNSEETYVSFSL